MFVRIFLSWLALGFFLPAPGAFSGEHPIRYSATIHPLTEILAQITRGRAEVVTLLSPGSSPHTFEPRPSDLILLDGAKALFYAGPGLDKEWIGRLPAAQKIELVAYIPDHKKLFMEDHDHGEDKKGGSGDDGADTIIDPHFWTDPMTIHAMVPELVNVLVSLDPEGEGAYRANGYAFQKGLERLDVELEALLVPCRGISYFLFHPSFNYLFARYNLHIGGVIEPFPGREPGPRFLAEMTGKIKKSGSRIIYTEPQLSKRSATILAEAAKVGVGLLDPLGGVDGRMSYEQILRFNGQALRNALENGER